MFGDEVIVLDFPSVSVSYFLLQRAFTNAIPLTLSIAQRIMSNLDTYLGVISNKEVMNLIT